MQYSASQWDHAAGGKCCKLAYTYRLHRLCAVSKAVVCKLQRLENITNTVPHSDQDMATETDRALKSRIKLIMGHFENHISSSIIRICFQFSSIGCDQSNVLAQQFYLQLITEQCLSQNDL